VVEEVSNGGTTLFRFHNFDNGYKDEQYESTLNQDYRSSSSPVNSKNIERGKLKQKKIWDSEGKPISETSYQYTSMNQDFVRVIDLTVSSGECGLMIPFGTSYKIYTYPYLLTSETNTVYDQTNANRKMVQTTQYEYADNLLPKKITTTDSQGKTIITTTQYAYETDNVTKNKNMLHLVAEQQTQVGTQVVSKTQNVYIQQATTNNILLNTITHFPTGSTAFEEIGFHYDLKGNIIEFQKQNDIHTSFIWGYYQSYPIAKVNNAEIDQIFYTGFEEATTGVTTNNAKTGRKYWNIATYTVPVTITLYNPQDLVMTYWWRDSNGVWQFQSEAAYTQTITKSGATGLDDIRVYPKGALMTTYTYDPLVGMTSATDPNGQTIYYEYDAFGRLAYIKDEKGNIVKEQKYHYKGQPLED
jgi:YD repeat-containing protein